MADAYVFAHTVVFNVGYRMDDGSEIGVSLATRRGNIKIGRERLTDMASVHAWCEKNGGEIGLRTAIANGVFSHLGNSRKLAEAYLLEHERQRDQMLKNRSVKAAERSAKWAGWALAISLLSAAISVAALYLSRTPG